MNKYRNKPVTVGGITFDSKAEERRWEELLLMEKAKEITKLQRQVRFELIPFLRGENRNERKATYVADFTYYENDRLVVEDCKGLKTPTYILKRKLMLYVHGISIRETG